MMPVEPAEAVAGGMILCAALQLVLASWRDLGPLTLAFGGAAVALSLREPSADVPLLVLVGTGIAVLAWVRSVRHGVGRLAWDGFALCGAVLASALPDLPGPLAARAPDAALFCGLGIGIIAQIGALERKGDRRPRPWVKRRVPVG